MILRKRHWEESYVMVLPKAEFTFSALSELIVQIPLYSVERNEPCSLFLQFTNRSSCTTNSHRNVYFYRKLMLLL